MSLTEDEIRPHQFEAEKDAAMQRDLNWLKQRAGGFLSVPCPACEGSDSTPEFCKYGFQFARCLACRTAYMNPRAPADMLAEFYKGSALYEFWNEHIFPASREIRREKIFRPRVERLLSLCRRLGVPTDTLVDVGAANGTFCEEAKKFGVFSRVIAVEPGHALAETCRGLGIETIEAPVERVSIDGGADVVTSFETVEHLFSPADFMHKCKRLLRPDGLIVLTCPNYEGFDIQTLGVESESLDAEHVNLFNPDSIQRLLERTGFRVVECSTPGELDAELVRRKVLDGAVDLSGQPLLKTVLLEQWGRLGGLFQEFLKAARLSSHMWVVAQNMR